MRVVLCLARGTRVCVAGVCMRYVRAALRRGLIAKGVASSVWLTCVHLLVSYMAWAWLIST